MESRWDSAGFPHGRADGKLLPLRPLAFDAAPEFVRTERPHYTAVQFIAVLRRFGNTGVRRVFATVRGQRIHQPGGELAGLLLRPVSQRRLNVGHGHTVSVAKMCARSNMQCRRAQNYSPTFNAFLISSTLVPRKSLFFTIHAFPRSRSDFF